MYCHKCSAFNDDNAECCVGCGHILQELREIPEPEEVQPGDAPAPTQARAPGAGSPRGGAPRRRALRESIPTYLAPAILSCLWSIPFGLGLAFYVSATIYSLMSTPEVYD